MPKKKEYIRGENIGPHESIIFLAELPPMKKRRRALFHCNQCNKTFESDIAEVNRGKRGCHCSRILDLTGQKFGKLTVLSFEGIDKNRQSLWKVKCSCEKETEFIVNCNSLTTGNTSSCGCNGSEIRIKRAEKEMIGKTFGKLTVLERVPGKRKEDNFVWKCECSCDNHTIVEVDTRSLTDFRKTSCGCLISKGEYIIQSILIALDINYEKEKIFEDCINPKTNAKLRFDFYLPDYNCCIEYDGEQHTYFSSKGWNTEEHFKQTVYRDSIKNAYCEQKHIALIRIPYTDYSKINQDYILKLLKERIS